MARSYKDMTDKELRDQAAQNSRDWYNAGADKEGLHQANVEINAELDSRNNTKTTYDSASGTWSSSRNDRDTSSGDSYGGSSGGSSTGGYYYKVNDDGRAPGGLSVGDNVVTGGGTYRIDAVNPDGTYRSTKINDVTTSNYTGTYRNVGAGSGIPGSTPNYSQEEQLYPVSGANASLDYEALRDLLAQNATAPQVDTTWKEIADKLANAYIGMDYNDWTSSDQYKALADRYGRQGQMTMQDILGQIASRTGGLASSYATTAAQQQYNDYMAALEQAARQGYNEDRQQMYNNASMALDYYGRDYNEYLNQLAQQNKDREYNLDLIMQAMAQANKDREWQNTLDRQRIADQQYADSLAYQKEQDAYARQQEEAAASAYAPTFKWSEVKAERDRAEKSGAQLTGNMLRDYNYYMYGDPDYSASSPTVSNYTATPSGPKAGVQFNNGGLDEWQVKKLQAALGFPASEQDGFWGPATQKAAKEKWGITSADEAWKKYGGGTTAGGASGGAIGGRSMASVDYSPDEGVIYWNGHGYGKKDAFADDIETAYNRGELTTEQLKKILNSLNAMGVKF